MSTEKHSYDVILLPYCVTDELYVFSVTFAQLSRVSGHALAPKIVHHVVAQRVVRAGFTLTLIDLDCNKTKTLPVSADDQKIFVL